MPLSAYNTMHGKVSFLSILYTRSVFRIFHYRIPDRTVTEIDNVRRTIFAQQLLDLLSCTVGLRVLFHHVFFRHLLMQLRLLKPDLPKPITVRSTAQHISQVTDIIV